MFFKNFIKIISFFLYKYIETLESGQGKIKGKLSTATSELIIIIKHMQDYLRRPLKIKQFDAVKIYGQI